MRPSQAWKNFSATKEAMILKALLVLLSVAVFYRSIFPCMRLQATVNTEALSENREFKKLVYVVLDGLRFDGLVPVDKEGHYFNNMAPLDGEGIHRHDFLSIAGIPTSTTCRVIGLMTGAPSSRLDVIKSFSNTRVDVDSLVSRADGRSCAFYGDELWIHSFVRLAAKSKTICSFSKDRLAAREDEVFAALMQNLSGEPDDFVFAHFISLDNLGHTHGTRHPAMGSTIRRFSGYLQEICATLDRDTLLVVVSDHGVTDEGAHGGVSEPELASVCSFISKKPIRGADPRTGPGRASGYASFLGRFYDVARCNTAGDWLKARSRYNVIHQDDIVVTVSYLLGVPVPFNAFGNLIPHLVDDHAAQRRLARLKEANTGKGAEMRRNFAASGQRTHGQKTDGQKTDADSHDWHRRYNYFLTDAIYSRLSERSYLGAALSLLIALGVLYYSIARSKGLLGCLHVLFATAMVSHSYRAFASEDYFWFAAFLAENPTLSNLLAFVFYVKAPGRAFLQGDRLGLNRRLAVLGLGKFGSCAETLFFLAAFVLSKAVRGRPTKQSPRGPLQFDARFTRNTGRCLPQLLFAVYRLAAGADDRESRLAFLAAFCSPESLVAIHFAPHNAILLLYVLTSLDMKHTPSTRYSLLALLPYLGDIEKTVQSIDFNAFFVFTDRYDSLSVLASVLAYFVLPRLLFTLEFARHERAQRNSNQHAFPALVLLGLYACLACSWFMYNSLVFDYFFMGRALFVTGYSLFDYALQTVLFLAGRAR